MIRRSKGRPEKKTIRDVLDEPFRGKAIARLIWWADLLEIHADLIYDLPFPTNATGSTDGVNIAVKNKFMDLIKTPKVMAKVLGAKNGDS